MKVNEFLEVIKESYRKEFPNSLIIAKLHKGLGKSLYIKCYIAGSKEEFYNGIAQNDMLDVEFWCHDLPKDIEIESELPENITLENNGKSYMIKPDNNYMCYSRRKLSYRKVVGIDKNIKSLDRFFKKLKEQLIKDINYNMIHENHIELLKQKIK